VGSVGRGDVIAELNRLANGGVTYRTDDQVQGSGGAANAWAGTVGLDVVGALNAKAGVTGQNRQDLDGICNQLAGTSGLAAPAALAAIQNPPTMAAPTASQDGVGSMSVAFTPVTATPDVTSYTVTSTPGGLTATGTASPLIVSGTATGTSYTFTVHATNLAGDSPESPASAAVTSL
jgi:hypothetical protein